MFTIEVSILGRAVKHPDDDRAIGTVIEIDSARSRARVKWSDKRTWIAFKQLRLA